MNARCGAAHLLYTGAACCLCCLDSGLATAAPARHTTSSPALLLCLYPVFTLTQPPPSPHSVTGRCNDLIHQDILSVQCSAASAGGGQAVDM